MIVVTLSNCPNALKGLSKWLFEADVNVYVGEVSARVRDNLWEMIKEEAPNGRATMVYATNNEQGFDFKTHNSDWEAKDFDGVKIMTKPHSPIKAEKIRKELEKYGER